MKKNPIVKDVRNGKRLRPSTKWRYVNTRNHDGEMPKARISDSKLQRINDLTDMTPLITKFRRVSVNNI